MSTEPTDADLARIEAKLYERYRNAGPWKATSWVDASCMGFFTPTKDELENMQKDRDLAYIETLLQYGGITIEQARQHLQDPSVIRSWQEAARPYITSLEKFLALGLFTPASCQSAISRLLGEKLLTMADLTPKLHEVFFRKKEQPSFRPQMYVAPGDAYLNSQRGVAAMVQNTGDCPITVQLDITFHPEPGSAFREATYKACQDLADTIQKAGPPALSWVDDPTGAVTPAAPREQPTLCGAPLVFTDKTPTLGDLKLGTFEEYLLPAGTCDMTESEKQEAGTKYGITCPRDHHTMPDPCRRDYCSCSCAFCKQSCGD